MTQQAFTITVYDGTVDSNILDEAVALYREVYSEPPYLEGDEDFAGFANDLPQRVKQENFRMVIACLGTKSLGFALGHRLAVPTHWWDGAVSPLPEDVISEHTGRTFAVIELAVRKSHRRHGVGRRLHAHLTADLSEERKTLLVRPDAAAARCAYLHWGYRKVGQIQPYAKYPVYDAMVSD